MKKPRILIYDIETAPLQTYTWGLYDQNIAPNQLKQDWHLLSWSAKWLGESKITYLDQRGVKDITNDKKLCEGIWKLLDEADIVITQNGKSFDQKKLYARFILHGFKPPSPAQHIDTREIARRHFGFTSNSLAYLSEKLSDEKKSEHKKFPGMELWKECLRGNLAAWKEMEKYNKKDVIVLEKVYNKLSSWDSAVSRASSYGNCRVCDGHRFKKNGFKLTASGKFQQLQCLDCGAWMREGSNLLTKKQRDKIKRKI